MSPRLYQFLYFEYAFERIDSNVYTCIYKSYKRIFQNSITKGSARGQESTCHATCDLIYHQGSPPILQGRITGTKLSHALYRLHISTLLMSIFDKVLSIFG